MSENNFNNPNEQNNNEYSDIRYTYNPNSDFNNQGRPYNTNTGAPKKKHGNGVFIAIIAVLLCVSATARVHLLRNNDPTIQQRKFKLRLRITENSDLRPEGQRDFTITYSDIRPTQRPGWWNTWDPLPEYSFENAQLFFKYFYELAPKANKSVYDEMIAAYGDYFVKAGSMRGPLSMYDNFLIQYVLIPMYNDTKDQITWQTVPQIH